MTKQKTRDELINDILVERRRLEKTLSKLSEIDMPQQGVVGIWSIKDVLAHIIAWEQLFLDWYESGLKGKKPETTPVGMSGKAINALNQKIYNKYHPYHLNEVLAEFDASYQEILGVVKTIPEEKLFSSGYYAWTGKLALADYIVGNTCNHYRWAKDKILRWLKTKNM